MTRQPSRRALCIGISTFGSAQGEPTTDTPVDLPYALQRAQDVQLALDGLGYESLSADAQELATADALGKAVKDRLVSSAAGTVELVHVLTHGVLAASGLYLVGADGRHSPDTDVAHWMATVESFPDRPTTLFLLDTCHSGDAARLSWLPAARDGTRAWVIAATTGRDAAYDGVFSTAVAQVLTEIVDGRLDVYPSRYVPFGVLVEQIRRRVGELGVREQIVTSTPVDGAPEPPFVPNPRRPADPVVAQAVRESDEVLRPFLDLDVSLDAAHFADRAAGRPLDRGLRQGVFTGRRNLLRDLSRWLEDGRAPLRVVTGGAGSGKSAVLGILVCAAHRGLREATAGLRDSVPDEDLPQVVDNLAGVHLRERDLQAAVQGLCRQLSLPATAEIANSPEDAGATLVAAISRLPQPPVIVVDALDEAIEQQAIMDRLLIPLAEARRSDSGPVCRLLIGTRPWDEFEPLFHLADGQGDVADLDAISGDCLRAELAEYVKDLLATEAEFTVGERRGVAEGVADALLAADRPRGGEFLAAALYANALSEAGPGWLRGRGIDAVVAAVPVDVPELLDLDLSRPADGEPQDARRWALPVLTAIAHGNGSGMPSTVIRRLAPIFADPDVCRSIPAELSDDVLRQTLARVRFYLRSAPGPDGLTVYRLFHQRLVDHLRPIEHDRALRVLGEVFDRLTQPALDAANGSRNWPAAEPYVQTYWLEHAIDAGRLDEVLRTNKAVVRAVCNTRTTPQGRLTGAIWHHSVHQPTWGNPAAFRSMLALNALRFGAVETANRLAATAEPIPMWWPTWSTGNHLSSQGLRRVLTRHAKWVSMACTVMEGRPIGITLDENTMLRTWDLTTGNQIREWATGHDGLACSVACTTLRGRPVAVTVGRDRSVRIWDLTAGCPVGEPLIGHRGWIEAVACCDVRGRPVAVTAGSDRTVRIWDLTAGTQIGEPLTGHSERVNSMACSIVSGQPIAVTASSDSTLRIWDLIKGAQIGEALTGHAGFVCTVACTTLDGYPIAVTGGEDGTVRIWDLSTGRQIGRPLTGHTDRVKSVACIDVDGRPVAVSGSRDETVRIWDLNSGFQLGEPLVGHAARENSVACTIIDGRPVALDSGKDMTVRIWDLTTATQAGKPSAEHTNLGNSSTYAAIEGGTVTVDGLDGSPQVWDLISGKRVDDPNPTGKGRALGWTLRTKSEGSSVWVSIEDERIVTLRPAGTWETAWRVPLPDTITALTMPSSTSLIVGYGCDIARFDFRLPSGDS